MCALKVCIHLFPRFREKLGVKTVKALKRNHNGVTHAAVDMLCALMCVSDQIIYFGGDIKQIYAVEKKWTETLFVMSLHSQCTTTTT